MLGVPEYLGHPLLKDDGFYATAASDLFFHWNPGKEATLVRVHHPLSGVDIEISPSARFGGYPPVITNAGVAVADDTTHRFMAVLTGQTSQRWHIEDGHSLGIPASRDGMIYMGFGGPGAVKGLVALNAGNGTPVWTYAPKEVAVDVQDMLQIKSPKAVNVPVVAGRPVTVTIQKRQPDRRTLGANVEGSQQQVTLLKPEVVGMERKIIEVPAQQPYARDPFGHWSNSGVVMTDSMLYAEADGKIVALDRMRGEVAWEHKLPAHSVVHSLIATKEHLLFSVSTALNIKRAPVWEMAPKPDKTRKTYLIAIKLKDGEEVWKTAMARPGNLVVASGRLFYMDGALRVLESAPEPESEAEQRPNGITP